MGLSQHKAPGLRFLSTWLNLDEHTLASMSVYERV